MLRVYLLFQYRFFNPSHSYLPLPVCNIILSPYLSTSTFTLPNNQSSKIPILPPSKCDGKTLPKNKIYK